MPSRRRAQRYERLFRGLALLAIGLPLALLALLLLRVAWQGASRLTLDFLIAAPSRRPSVAGLGPALAGSLWLIGVATLLALPLGVMTALYLEEYGKRTRLANVLELAIANLAGVPSIVYGILGLGLFVRALALGETVLAGGATLAIIILPVIIVTTREALRTVPQALREAALGLGASRLQTLWRVVLPAALPGMLTGSILAVSRALGETAPLIVVGAVAYIRQAPRGLTEPYTALPMQIYNWTGMPQPAFATNAAAAIIVLMLTMLTLNLAAIVLRHNAQRRTT